MAEKVLNASGAPTTTGNQIIGSAYAVPAGKVWTVKHALLTTECINVAVTPEGGEMTPYVETDVGGSYVTLLDSSLETGNRYASQGSGPVSHILTEGQHLRFSYFLRVGKTAADYEYTITVILDES